MNKQMSKLVGMMLITCIFIVSFASFVPSMKEVSKKDMNSAYVERLFHKDRIIDIYINIIEDDFKDMLENPTKEEYKQAALVVDGETIKNVGFRIKGNSSLNMVAGSDSDRYSFKIDFDHYIDGQNLLGLTKLNLNNSISDPSYMREYLSYYLLNEMGIPTPAFCYTNIYINGELYGLYLAVEGIEEPFLERYYGSDYGDLYKPEGTGSDLVYIDDHINSYSGITLKTDKKNDSDKNLIAMLKALNKGKDLEKYLHVDEILRYFAVNTVLMNMDSYQGNLKHNYYLYEEDGKFSILPWDYNMSFAGFGGRGKESEGSSKTSLYIDQPVSGTTLDQRPLIGKLLEIEEYRNLYHQYIEEFIEGPFSLENMSIEIEKTAEMIRKDLEKDPTKFYTMEQFEKGIKEGSNSQTSLDRGKRQPGDMGDGGGMMNGENAIGLIKFVRERIENVSKQLSGVLPTQGDDVAAPAGDFLVEMGGERDLMKSRSQGGRGNPPEGLEGKMNPRGRNQNMMQSYTKEHLYIIGISLLILVGITLGLMKKRNKYSI